MVLVRIKDKRYHIGYNIKFFKTDTITDEVIQFIKSHPKAYWVECGEKIYRSREELKELLNPRKRWFTIKSEEKQNRMVMG